MARMLSCAVGSDIGRAVAIAATIDLMIIKVRNLLFGYSSGHEGTDLTSELQYCSGAALLHCRGATSNIGGERGDWATDLVPIAAAKR